MEVTLGKVLASVKRETYTAILREREKRKFGDRFRRRVGTVSSASPVAR